MAKHKNTEYEVWSMCCGNMICYTDNIKTVAQFIIDEYNFNLPYFIYKEAAEDLTVWIYNKDGSKEIIDHDKSLNWAREILKYGL